MSIASLKNMYYKPFWIHEEISNNAFSFKTRQSPKLFVPALKEGTIKDVEIGQEIVFEDFDDDGKLQSCRGLSSFIKATIDQIPVYVFDNHNHAFYFWQLSKVEGILANNAMLIHFDQHKDNRMPKSFLSKNDSENLEKLFDYTNSVLNVGNFIPAAQHTDLITDIIFINSEASLIKLHEQIQQKSFFQNHTSNLILDIDLDFFAPEFDYIDNNLKIETIKNLIPKSKIITVALSPFFIDQKLALNYLNKIFSSF